MDKILQRRICDLKEFYRSHNSSYKWPERDWRRLIITMELLEKAKFERVLDVGPGQGQFVNLAGSVWPGLSITTIDITVNSRYVEIGGLSCEKYIENIDLPIERLRQLPIAQKFDFVNAQEVLEHISIENLPDVVLFLSEISQKGVLFSVPFCEKEPLYHFDKPYGHKQSFDEENLSQIFKDSIFVPIVNDTWWLGYMSSQLGTSGKVDSLDEFKLAMQRSLMA